MKSAKLAITDAEKIAEAKQGELRRKEEELKKRKEEEQRQMQLVESGIALEEEDDLKQLQKRE